MNQKQSFYIGLLLAFILLYVGFSWQPLDFWVLFPCSLFILTIWSWLFEQHNLRLPPITMLLAATLCGIVLYSLFAFGKWFVLVTDMPLLTELESLYRLVKPTETIHYSWLFLIIIPGEEWFWRGFIVKRLSTYFTNDQAAIVGTLLYAGAHFATGSMLLVLAALTAGFVWSLLYLRTNNIGVPIVSHITLMDFSSSSFPSFKKATQLIGTQLSHPIFYTYIFTNNPLISPTIFKMSNPFFCFSSTASVKSNSLRSTS